LSGGNKTLNVVKKERYGEKETKVGGGIGLKKKSFWEEA